MAQKSQVPGRVHVSVALGALVATLLTGCVADPPAPEDIRAQALTGLVIDHPWKAVAGTEAVVLDDWLSTFHDPVLDALVREALIRNPDLRVAAARMEQSGAYLNVAQAALRPQVGIGATGGMKAGGGGDPSSALQGAVLAASWELDLWGRVRYARNAAREAFASAQADFAFAQQSLAAATAKAWFTATQLTLQTTLAQQMVDSSRQLEGFAVTRQRVGVGSEVDTASARAATRVLEDSAAQLDYARGQALRALELLVGRYPAGEVSARADLLALPDPPPVGVPLQMLERRPDVIAAERRVAAAFNKVGEAKAARLPQLSVNLNFGAFSSEILALKQDYENPSGGLGGRVMAPLYTGGALSAQVEIRTLEQKEAVANYARIALRALGDVENALAAGDSLNRRITALSAALDEQSRGFELTQTRNRVGRADSRAVEQQRMSVANARMALLNVQTEALAQRVNLHLALGGSFEVPQVAAATPPASQ